MNIDFEPSKLVNEVKTHLPDLTEVVFRRRAHDMGMNASELLRDLVCEFVHGAPYLDLVIEHRRGTRDMQGQAQAEPGPKLRPVEAAILATGPYGVRK
jgi:hypothetical protein